MAIRRIPWREVTGLAQASKRFEEAGGPEDVGSIAQCLVVPGRCQR
jgi:hypothetical protein